MPDNDPNLAQFADATVLVTGISDIVGLNLLTTLKRMGAKVIGIGDLRSDLGSLQYLENEIGRFRPQYVFYVPSERYGIAVHKQSPGTVYYESVIIFSHLLEACRHSGVQKVVNVLSNCVYPADIPIPYREADIWQGLPETTLIPHGMGRRMSLIHATAYRQQHGLRTISLVLASVYGPNDHFDPATAQVMASNIHRFVVAADQQVKSVQCWGSGAPTREFIHVRDAVRGILEAAVHYDVDEALNIGSQHEVSIRELTDLVADCAGYRGEIVWDSTKPDGRPRVCLDSSRMRALLSAWGTLSLEEGVAETVAWYRATAPFHPIRRAGTRTATE